MKGKNNKVGKLSDMPTSIQKFINDNFADIRKTELRTISIAMCELELLNDKAIREDFGASLYFEKLKEKLIKDIESNPENYNGITRDPDQTMMVISPLELVDDNVRCVIITPFSLACFIEIEVSDYLYHQERSVDTGFLCSSRELWVNQKIGEA